MKNLSLSAKNVYNFQRKYFSAKKRVVVLGTGWGGFRFVKDVDKRFWDVTVVSPRNHFIFTPLLPSTTVGTLEFRAIIEPIRTVNNNFIQAYCRDIKSEENRIVCEDHWTGTKFNIDYDYLVLAVGAESNTFNTPGVKENCCFLKQVSDSRKIRERIIMCFEEASAPYCPKEDRERLLSFAVVGGGPTSVEFAAELHDFIISDVRRFFPNINIDEIKINLIEASEHILGTFDNTLSSYTEKHFQRQKINLLLKSRVKEVKPGELHLVDGRVIPFGLCVWSTGNAPNELIRSLNWHKEDRSGRLLVDNRLRVLEKSNIFAIGDCAVIKEVQLPQTAQCAQQEGKYLVGLFKQLQKGNTIENIKPFIYYNQGMLAYIGENKALANVYKYKNKGFFTFIFWRSAYLTKLVSIRNKILVPMYWFKTLVFGRDISSF
jgi:NADH dehydrogenase FAD-containing subunit